MVPVSARRGASTGRYAVTVAALVAGVSLAATAQAALPKLALHKVRVTQAANDCNVPPEWTDALSRLFADTDYNLRLERDDVARPLSRLISNLGQSRIYLDENALKGIGNTLRSLSQMSDLSGPVVNFLNDMQGAPLPQCPSTAKSARQKLRLRG